MVFANESQLIDGLKAGESRAVNRWYTASKQHLRAYFVKHIASDLDVDELIHDTYLSCLSSLPLFRGTSGLFSWMMGIARHELADYWRKKYAKRAIQALPFGEELLGAIFADPTREDRAIGRTLSKLPSSTAELLQLKYVDGLTIQEIADHYRLHPHALQSRLYRAKLAFQELYIKEQHEANS